MKKLILILLAIGFIAGTGCKKFIEGYDKNPNDPDNVTPALLLSNAEVAYFATMNGQLSRQSVIMAQQVTGVDFQSKDINDYAIDEATNVNEWDVIYTNGLVNLKKLYDQAGAENPYYQGMARVLHAMFLGVTTDLWGDIPNREALKGLDGPANFNPAYDAQQTVIADIQSYLTEAIALLSKTPAQNTLLPDADDLIYAGDADAWIAAAHVLKARYHNRLSKKDATASATDALASIALAYAAGFTSSDANCNAIFGANANEYNQWYAFTQVERQNYIKMGSVLVDTLKADADPRLSFYCMKDDSGKYTGTSASDASASASDVGPYLATANAPFPLVSYAEAKFIEAEAKFRKADLAGAATAHNEGVLASVLQVTGAAASAAFTTAKASETAATITLAKIMGQKYIALFGQIEVYSDWRRTGFPTLTPNSNGSVTVIPRRLPTVLDERLYNTKAPAENDIKKPVWWDQ
ncbi:MAG: SusD/RagB family nutrient-binding outer membrane lipoprotein [Bacteroidota bacterium]|nr:SusD/RagB family nutrient-binding outer membrane lipoprotein [Bacteroidota bacterium]